MPAELGTLLATQRRPHQQGLAVPPSVRRDRLRRAIDLLVTHSDAFCAALADDFGARSADQSRLFDVAVSIETLRHTMKHFERWMRPERRSVELPMRLAGAKAWIEYQPKGVVGLMSPWNFPITSPSRRSQAYWPPATR